MQIIQAGFDFNNIYEWVGLAFVLAGIIWTITLKKIKENCDSRKGTCEQKRTEDCENYHEFKRETTDIIKDLFETRNEIMLMLTRLEQKVDDHLKEDK